MTLGYNDASALITTSDAETLTIDPTGAGAIALGSADVTSITADAVAISLDATSASNFTVTGSGQSLTLSAAGGGAQEIAMSSAGTGASALNLDATAGGFTLDALTSLSIDVTGATGASNISVAADADAEDLTIAVTGSAGDLILSSADTLLVDATGVLELNSSAGVISIGNDAIAQNINIGTAGARALSLGSASATQFTFTTDDNSDSDFSFTGGATFNDDVTLTLTETENLAITNTITGSNSVEMINVKLTNASSGGTQKGITVYNFDDAANGLTENLIYLANLETTGNTISNYLEITATATDTSTTAINVSDPELFNGISLGDNFIVISGDSINDFNGSGLEVASNVLQVDLDTTAADGSTTSSTSGLEFDGNGELTLIRGCAAGGILEWDNTNFEWDCGTDDTGSGTNYWQLGSSVMLSPGNSTWDLLVGGTATASASFQAYGIETAAGGVADITSDVTTTGDVFGITSSTLTTGTLLNLNTGSSNTWTTGSLLKVNSTATSLTSGNLGLFDWSPTTWATASGDLVKVNIGQYGDLTGNLFALYDNSSELFSVDTAKITSALPHEFTAAGDVSIAYDLIFTNQTASTIDSYGPLTVRAGESFESNNLTLKTYNSGDIVFDLPATGQMIVQGAFALDSQQTLGDSVTPSVAGGSHFLENNSTNRLVTNFTNGTAGQIIYIEISTAANFDLDCTSSNINCGTTDITAFATGDQLFLIYDGTNWNLLGWMDASANNSDNTDGVDIAEFFPSIQSLSPGEVVKVDPENPEHVIKSASAYESRVVGVVSTNPGIVLGEAPGYPIALAGRVPVKISQNSGPIIPGDYLTTSPEPGLAMKSQSNGRVIGQALEPWSPGSGKDLITVFINNSWFEPLGTLTDSGDIKLAEDMQNEGYQKLIDKDGNLIDKLSGLTKIITDGFTAFQGTVDRMLVKVGLVSPQVLTKEIKPLDGEKDIAIQIGDPNQPSFGKLLLKNSSGKTVASVDEIGNVYTEGDISARSATFSGKLASDSLKTNEASIAGELRVGKVIADEVVSQNSLTREEIEGLLAEVEANQTLLAESQSWPTSATGSASLNELALENLYVTNTAAIDSLSVTHSIVVGSDLVIQSSLDTSYQLLATNIDTINAPLSIQSSASQPLYLMAGLVQIDTLGNIQIAGDVTIGGTLSAKSLRLDADSENLTNFGKLLSVTNSLGDEVASVSATGSAEFKGVTTDRLTIKDDPNATSSAILSDMIYHSEASAGIAKVPSRSSVVTIKNPNVKSNSLVFVTPTSPTQNNVLYIKEQKDGEIVVGFDLPTVTDVTFNWWIVDLTASR